MKIAVATTKGMVSYMLSNSETFEIFDTETEKFENLENCFDGCRFIADILSIKNVKIVLATKIGEDMKKEFDNYNIKVFEAKYMETMDAIKKYLKGDLEIVKPDSTYNDSNFSGCKSCH